MFGIGHEELRREIHRLEMRVMQMEQDLAQQLRTNRVFATRLNKLCEYLGVRVTYSEPLCRVIELEPKGKTNDE